MSWAPDGSKILIGGPSRGGETSPLATLNPDGTGYERFVSRQATPDLWVRSSLTRRDPIRSPMTHLAGDGWYPEVDGIMDTVRASDGGDVIRLSNRRGMYASYSPDGWQIGVRRGPGDLGRVCTPLPLPAEARRPPDGSLGDERRRHRSASDRAPMALPHLPELVSDGRWILFSDARGNRRRSPRPDRPSADHAGGSGAARGDLPVMVSRRTRFVFVGGTGSVLGATSSRREETAPDVEQITHTHDINYRTPDWGTTAG